jgi:hypothetical protein
MLFLLLA